MVIGTLSAIALERGWKQHDRVALGESAASLRDFETAATTVPRSETGASSHKHAHLYRLSLETLSRQLDSAER
ncbi:hypothetical protein [Methylobacterium hispanicum]|uniref:hypothetical protein n=1 Tax=Methylobacterium hispanicum TaxID=270350 RepID=UPI002F360DA2